MLPRPIPEDLADLIARRFRVIGDPTRIRLLDLLRESESNVGDLATTLKTSQQNVSKHLGVLLDAGIVGRRKEGNHSIHFIADDSVFELCEQVCGSAQRQMKTLINMMEGAQ